MSPTVVTAVALAAILQLFATGVSATACSDCIIYDLSTQSNCVEVTAEAPTRDCRWKAGMSAFADQIVKGGKIIAYKIHWFNGSLSPWFVPGVNDLDGKFIVDSFPCAVPSVKQGLRRAWAYFFDHTHSYIICKST